MRAKMAYSELLNAQIVLTPHGDLDKLMEALFFIRCWRPGLEAAGRGLAPSPGAGSPAARRQHRHPHLQETWEARRMGWHHSAAGAGAAGADGGAGAALLNSSPLPTRLLQG